VNAAPPAGRRVGRALAWTVAVATILSTFALVFLPLAGQLIAQLTWSSERKESCLEGVEACAVTAVPFGSWLTGVAVGWAALIVFALVVCWSPRRWWTPTGRVTARRPGVFSTPEWLRLHAVVALIVIPVGLGITSGRTSTLVEWGMLWGAGLALAAIVLASVCIRTTVTRIDAETRAGLAKEYSFWLLASETRLRRSHGASAADPAELIEHHRRSLGASPRRAAREQAGREDLEP
jgi:hypothetical protein